MEKQKMLFGYREEDWFQLESSNLDKATYDYVTQEMLIIFHNGSCYSYANVPENIFTELKVAKSAGKFFNSNILLVFKCKKIS